jgi:hypothetical protein
MNFKHILSGVDVDELLSQIQSQPELWNKNPCRLGKHGPHHETQDMFLRYKAETEHIERNDWHGFADAHFAIWNKTIDYLPAARPIIFDLMAHMEGEILGGVFLYKIEPGCQIYPHTDQGWHPEFYEKFNICLQSNPQTAFHYAEDAMVQEGGDVHWFRNDVKHWVVNEGKNTHIVLTVCMRLDNGERAPWSPDSLVKQVLGERPCLSAGQ